MEFKDIGWGLGISGIGILIVFSMLLILMLSLFVMTAFDKPEKAETPAAIEAPAAAALPAAAPAPAAVAAVPASGMTDEKIATLAVAIHTALRGGGNKSSLVANQSGSGLNESRWVAIGRSLQTQSWHRS